MATLALAGCAGMKGKQPTQAWDDARQMVVVTTADWNANTGTLQRYGQWPDPAGVVSFASVVF